uniref:CS domain-containing protein n=1 Tax=Prymnesium polylepis TaxID=72548 RepID=A0A7S4MF94_9EUKA
MQAYAEHAEAAANGAPQLPPVNDKNGGETSWGSWEQTKPEVTAFVKLPPGVKPRDCNVKFSSTAIKVSVKGQPDPLLDDMLAAAVVADGCFWEISEGSMVITLEKELQAKACGREDKTGWWERVVQGDEPKETLYCDREPFMLGDMDDLKHENMRYHISQMIGTDDPGLDRGGAWDGTNN